MTIKTKKHNKAKDSGKRDKKKMEKRERKGEKLMDEMKKNKKKMGR